MWKKFIGEENSYLEPIYYEEAFDTLKNILMVQQNEFGNLHVSVAETFTAMGLVYLKLGNFVIVNDYLTKVVLYKYPYRPMKYLLIHSVNTTKVPRM